MVAQEQIQSMLAGFGISEAVLADRVKTNRSAARPPHVNLWTDSYSPSVVLAMLQLMAEAHSE